MTVMANVVETNESTEDSGEEFNSPEEDVNSSEEDVEIDEETGGKLIHNTGWADSIAKILKTNKPKGKKTLVLSKAKKLCDVNKKKIVPAGFEIATTDGKVKKETIEIEEKKSSLEPPRKKKKDVLNLRVKPNILERDRERTLSKIATKGVVQLFNAVKMQQKDISKKLEEARPLEVRKEKVLKSIDKRAFLDVLMGGTSQNVEESANLNNELKRDTESTWGVLRDDFMMGAKLKDWDKEINEMQINHEHDIKSE